MKGRGSIYETETSKPYLESRKDISEEWKVVDSCSDFSQTDTKTNKAKTNKARNTVGKGVSSICLQNPI